MCMHVSNQNLTLLYFLYTTVVSTELQLTAISMNKKTNTIKTGEIAAQQACTVFKCALLILLLFNIWYPDEILLKMGSKCCDTRTQSNHKARQEVVS